MATTTTPSSGPADAAAPASALQAIDREKHCPFLLRVFSNVGSHNKREAYEQLNDRPIANELHVYTWPDATLREIADLVMDANADARKPTARMGFSVVSQERNGRIGFRKAGWVYANRRKTADEDKTLESLRFQPGDFFDVAILQ